MKFRRRMLVWSMVSLPVHSPDGWQVLEYSKLKSNTVKFDAKGMTIAVDGSASPVIFPLKQPVKVAALTFKGKSDGRLNLPEKLKQGEKGADDFTLRVGLVIRGDRRLSTVERWFAPKWIKTLYSLAPEGAGIDRIEFFNLVQQPALMGSARTHPLSDVLKENFVAIPNPNGRFSVQKSFSQAPEVLAIWVSSDGDDTKSQFTLLLENIVLTPAGNP